MTDPAARPMAALVVSAWIEGEPPTLRARLTYTVDSMRQPETAVMATSAEEVCAATRAWITAFEQQTERPRRA